MTSALAVPAVQAQVVNYSLSGNFTGINSGNAALVNAIAPVLGIGAFSVQLSIDVSAPGSPLFSGGTLYRPLSNTSMSFAGFTGTTEGCTSPGEFICTVQVRNGTGLNGTGGDSFLILTDIARSTAFNAAVGESRPLDFQFILGLFDFTGTLLSDESLGLDLTQQNPAAFFGSFAVFAPGQNGFDRADFGVELSSITLQQTVPEPSGYALLLVGLAGMCSVATRRSAQATGMTASRQSA